MANLSQLARARRTAKKHGWRVVSRDDGPGKTQKLHFYGPAGERIDVWYPWEGRTSDGDERDLDDAINTIAGAVEGEEAL